MPKVTIIYDSRTGNVARMAEAVAEGVRASDEVEVVVKRVEEASGRDLLESDGVILGSPTHCGGMSWKMKKLLDEGTEAWGKVNGKIGAAFTR